MVDSLPPDSVFLANCEEATFSEILQRQQRIVLQIELVDTARPQHQMKREALRGYLIPTGGHRVQFRVLLPSAGLTDSRAREARGSLTSYLSQDIAIVLLGTTTTSRILFIFSI